MPNPTPFTLLGVKDSRIDTKRVLGAYGIEWLPQAL
jgi:hypothetical protein